MKILIIYISLLLPCFCLQVFSQETYYISGDVKVESKFRVFKFEKDSAKLKVINLLSDFNYLNQAAFINHRHKVFTILAQNNKEQWMVRFINLQSPQTLDSVFISLDSLNIGWGYYPILYKKNNKIFFMIDLYDDSRIIKDRDNPNDHLHTVCLTDKSIVKTDYTLFCNGEFDGDSPCTYTPSQMQESMTNFWYRDKIRTSRKGNVKIHFENIAVNDSNLRIPVDANIPDTLEVTYRPNVYIQNPEMVVIHIDTIPYKKMGNENIHENSDRKFWVYNKKYDKGFVQLVKGTTFRFKAFGKYLTGAEIWEEIKENGKPKKSIGYEMRKNYPYKGLYYFDAKNGVEDNYQPGILYIIDTQTKQKWEWQTGQGDSEILYINDKNEIYYRVFHRIYKRSFDKKGLKQPQLVLEDLKNVPFVHWMWQN